MMGLGDAYQALDVADEHAVQDFTGLVAVANVLEGLGGILASHVEQNLLTTAIRIVSEIHFWLFIYLFVCLLTFGGDWCPTYGCSSTKAETS